MVFGFPALAGSSLSSTIDTTPNKSYIERFVRLAYIATGNIMSISVKKIIAATFAVIVTAGCTSTANQDSTEIERRLSAAGFQMKLANTPEKMEHLKRLGQRRLVPMELKGETVFVYADGELCKCVFVGSQANYQEYERLSIQQHDVDEQRQTAQNINMAVRNQTMNWDLWGAWPRPILY